MIFDLLPKCRINCVLDESKMKSVLTKNFKLFDAIEIDMFEINENAEPSKNSTY
jgi:hypothetical protein